MNLDWHLLNALNFRSLKEQLDRQRAMRQVSNKVELEVLVTGGHCTITLPLLYLFCTLTYTVHYVQVRWLEGMATVDQKLKLTVRRLKDRLEQLDKDIGKGGGPRLCPGMCQLLTVQSKLKKCNF